MILNKFIICFRSKKISSALYDIYLVAIGFLLCQNIIVPIKIGNTPFNLLIFLLIPFIFYKVFLYRQNFVFFFKKIPIAFYFFVITIIISIIPALFMISVVKDISPFFKGVIFYFLSAILPLFLGIISNKKEKERLFFGLFIGFIMNTLVSIIVYLAFNVFGYTFTFTSLFKNDSFFEPNYFSSAQGLFLEPSHLAGFFLMSFYLLFWFYKEKIVRIMLFSSSWIVFILYGFGNLPIFILSQVVFIITMYGKKIKKIIEEKIFISQKRKIFFSIAILVIAVGTVLIIIFPLQSAIKKIIYEFNPFSNANQDRMNSLVVGLNVFLKNPFGVGFNLSGYAIDVYYGEVVTTATTHSFLLKVLIEQGILGVIALFYLIYSLIIGLRNKEQSSLLIISLLSSILFSFLNGPTEPYLFFLIGIICSISEYRDSLFFIKNTQ